MRQQRDADAERLDLARALIDAGGDAALTQIERKRKPANAATDDYNIHPCASFHGPFRENGRNRQIPVNMGANDGIGRQSA